ncbi:hypothetical protein NXF25_016160 [Crotalus adamanteus]|uniref:Shisa N-terminal domain-containing protein n=1 Tax=Crotalus adamanteus TaxID=8729 RepID=A0AAW1AVT9_CROAD
MEGLLPRGLLFLLFIGCTAGETRSDTCRLGPYGTPLLDDPMPRPKRSDASGESSSRRAETSLADRRKAGAGDPPAKESGGPRASLLDGILTGERSESPTEESEGDYTLVVQGDQCHKWIKGQKTPVQTFRCPIKLDHPVDIFCCGTCAIPYCCSSLKDRLDQTSCSRVVEETEDQGAGETALTSPKDQSTIKKIALILMIIGVTLLGIWIAFIIFLFRDGTEMINLDNEPPEMINPADAPPEMAFELRALVPADPPMPGPSAASGNPDPAYLGPEETQRPSGLPMAVADSAGGSGSPMDLETISPAVLLEGNLQGPSEERETVL